MCVGNRVLTNTSTVRTIWGAGGWCESQPPVAGIDRSVVGTKCVLLGWGNLALPSPKKNRKLRCPPPEDSAQKKRADRYRRTQGLPFVVCRAV